MSRRHTGNIQPQLDLEEHNGDAYAKNVTIRGANAGGTQFNNAIVDDSGALKVTGSGGGGGGTVDQGVAGTDPWLMAIDQTGTNNNVEAACTQVTSPWVVSGTVTTGGLTDAQLRASPVPISGTVTIQDGGNVITVDGTVAVSNQNTQYTEGDVDASITGTAVMGETTGNVLTPIQIDGNGAMKVAGHNGTLATKDSSDLADNGPFVDGLEFVGMAGYIFDEVAGTALTENDAAAARIDAKRAQVCTIEDETTRGRRATVTAANALKVDGSAVTQPVSDAGGTLTVDQATAANLNATVVQGTAANLNCTADTELEAPAALADGQGNPTIPRVGAVRLQAKYVDGTLSFDRRPHSYYQNRTGAGASSGAGTTVDMTMGPCSKYAMYVENGTGTTSAWNIDLQGSYDGSAWIILGNNTSGVGTPQAVYVTERPARFMRSNVVSVTGGGTVRIRILATES